MGNDAQVELVISSQIDRALAGISSFERSLANLEKAHGSLTVAANQNTAAIEKHGSAVESLTGKIGRLANLGNLFIAFEAIKSGLAAFDGLEQHNIDLLRTTEILGGNATAASTWSVVAHEMNISLTTIDRAFTKLSTDLNATGNPALKQMGIAAEDAHGKLRPLNDVINQAADYFHRHAGAVNNAALANALFGRSGYELLPILEQGRAGLNAITEEARKYGLILDATTIERNAAFTFQLKQAQLALDGLGMALGNAALPGLAALGQAFSRVVEDNLPAFISGVNRAVSYLLGFFEALTGMSMKVDAGAMALSSLNSITGDTGSAMDKAGGASNRLADAIQKVRDHTTAATRAIDDQIKSLNAQQAAESFMDRQAKLQQDLANKAHDIDKLRKQQYQEFWLGNFQTASDIGDQITQAQQDQANIQKQMGRNVEDESIKNKITALEKQKQLIQDASTKQIEAMQRAARGTTEAMAGAGAAMGPIFGEAGKTAAGRFKFAMDAGAEDIGKTMGSKLMDAMFGPQVWVDQDRSIKGHFERNGGQGFAAIGKAIGDSIGTGLTTALGKGLTNWWDDYLKWLKEGVGPGGAARHGLPPAYKSYDMGGKVPGPRGWPQLAIVHGGEEVRTPAQQRQQEATDMSETNTILREIAAYLATSSQGGSGGLAAVNALIDAAKRSRGRGVAGAFA